ncbi:MAG: hypothetical protein GC150_00250 [Rhizobiales bacterium]|nr:hypothetical protein [Hyphomicrobiales bacterium]
MRRRLITALAGAAVTVSAAAAGSAEVAWLGAGLTLTTLAALTARAVAARRAGARSPAYIAAAEIGRGFAALAVWAGLGMGGAYYLTDLSWYHAYQYALAFLLVAGSAVWISGRIGVAGAAAAADRDFWSAPWLLVAIAVLQLAGGIAAVVFLAASGKLFGMRADWMANVIFATAAAGLAAAGLAGLVALRGLIAGRAG